MRRFLRLMVRVATLLWASPNTAAGLLFGLLVVMTGGKARLRPPVLEFHGGAVRRIFSLPIHFASGNVIAITLGHVVLGVSEKALDDSREHELVHVRQNERWGPLFGPAYVLCSLSQWLRGKDPYRDNPFEREAYATGR